MTEGHDFELLMLLRIVTVLVFLVCLVHIVFRLYLRSGPLNLINPVLRFAFATFFRFVSLTTMIKLVVVAHF